MTDLTIVAELMRRVDALERRLGDQVGVEVSRAAITCRVRVTNQSAANGAFPVLLSYTTADLWDTHAMHSTSVNPTRVIVPIAGYYDIVATAMFASNATGIRQVYIRVNGATYQNSLIFPAVNGGETQMSLADAAYLAAGEYVEVAVYQNSGGALNVSGDLIVTYRGP